MSRTLVSPQLATHQGTQIATAAADTVNGNSFAPGSGAMLYVNNASGSPINVTLHTNVTVEGLVLPNRVTSVPAGSVEIFGPFSNGNYTQVDGNIWADFSAACTIAVITVGP